MAKTKTKSSKIKTVKQQKQVENKISQVKVSSQKTDTLTKTELFESKIDGSMRMFGIPHQFIAHNDPRIGTDSNLGRCFAERMIMEAPVIALKPGVSDFLPGMSDSKKKNYINGIMDAVSNNVPLSKVFSNMDADDDGMLYFTHKSKYSEMMAKVNALCKIMAVFLGIDKTKVPWAKGNVTFGNYDWRYYTMKNQFNDVTFENSGSSSGSVGAFIRDSMKAAGQQLMSDNEWVRFYVDSSASFSESGSNSTTSSILETFTEKLEGIAKELEVVSGISGADIQGMANSAASSVDNFIQGAASGNGAIATFLKRISGNTKQIISGGNFLLPEIWSSSEYNKNYSFSTTLTAPYGCVESWYLNIGVPICFILGFVLPNQLTANTYKSPYYVKAYSNGWFNCDLGIIDSFSMEKGADQSWSIGGLPNEVKVNISIKDLYSSLTLSEAPYVNPSAFLSNTGLMEFLMVNCGVDITHQDMDDRFKVWTNIFTHNIVDRFTATPYNVNQFFRSKFQNMFKIL